MPKSETKISQKQAFYVVFALAGALTTLVLVNVWNYFAELDELSIPIAEVENTGAVLTLSRNTESIVPGQTFVVHVGLETKGISIDGVDLYSLKYDPSILDVEDADRSQPGTQISPEGLLPIVTANRVDETLGLIQFAQVTNGGETFTGAGRLASITFKALKPGKVELSFDFKPGTTSDTNVAAYGIDKLKGVGALTVDVD